MGTTHVLRACILSPVSPQYSMSTPQNDYFTPYCICTCECTGTDFTCIQLTAYSLQKWCPCDPKQLNTKQCGAVRQKSVFLYDDARMVFVDMEAQRIKRIRGCRGFSGAPRPVKRAFKGLTTAS